MYESNLLQTAQLVYVFIMFFYIYIIYTYAFIHINFTKIHEKLFYKSQSTSILVPGAGHYLLQVSDV